MKALKLLNDCLTAFNQIVSTRLKGEYRNTYELAAAIDKLKRDEEENPPSFLLCYTTKKERKLINGRESIVSEGTRTIYTDTYIVFCEHNLKGETPEQQANNHLSEIRAEYEKENSKVILYTWNIARITQTQEHYNL